MFVCWVRGAWILAALAKLMDCPSPQPLLTSSGYVNRGGRGEEEQPVQSHWLLPPLTPPSTADSSRDGVGFVLSRHQPSPAPK